MKKICAVAFYSITIASEVAASLMPTADGTSWRYNMTEEIGKGLKIPDAKPDADGKMERSSQVRNAPRRRNYEYGPADRR